MKNFMRKIALPGLFVAAALSMIVGLLSSSQPVKAQVPVEFPWNHRVVLEAMAAETPQDAVNIVVSEFLNWGADKINLLEAGDLSEIETSDSDWWLVATDWHTTDMNMIPGTPVRNDYGYGVFLLQGEAIRQAPHQGVAIRLINWKSLYLPVIRR